MSRTHDVTISAFALDRLEAALDAAHKRRDHLEQALHRLIDAAHQRFQQPDPIHDYARVELFTALEQARNLLKSQISNLQSS